MKSILITLLVVGLLGGGLWWYGGKQREEQAALRAAREAEAAAAARDAKLELFGESGLDAHITWTDSGLGILTLTEGNGPHPLPGAYVKFNYIVRLKDGTEVQRLDKPTEARIGQMIPGVSSGLMQMRPGGRALLFIPPKLGYGSQAYGSIPPDSGLLFELELLAN
jgi:FKBP-type peptidyl-prolyl cis-trans isomerase